MPNTRKLLAHNTSGIPLPNTTWTLLSPPLHQHRHDHGMVMIIIIDIRNTIRNDDYHGDGDDDCYRGAPEAPASRSKCSCEVRTRLRQWAWWACKSSCLGLQHKSYMNTYIHTCIQRDIHTCIQTYIHTYISHPYISHPSIHTSIHTYIHT